MKYYVENVQRGCVGNCMLFWRHDDRGYGCSLAEAKVWDGDDPQFIDIASRPEKFRVWSESYLDGCTSMHVDMQGVTPAMAGIVKEEGA